MADEETPSKGRGSHPNSHRSLQRYRLSRPYVWGSPKHDHTLGLTDEAWQTLQSFAAANDTSASEVVECLLRLAQTTPGLLEQAMSIKESQP